MTEEQEKNTPLWSWSELTQALNLKDDTGSANVHRVIVDSRQARPGDLFVALSGDPGPRFNPSTVSDRDGHDFLEDAIGKGGSACLVDRKVKLGSPVLKVDNTYDGLWDIAKAARKRLSGPVIGVTGSSGKTTFKNFLVAGSQGYGSPASFNNHIGVPLSLANAPRAKTKTFTFEIGTNHPGEIEPLTRLVRPDIAVLLNVHQAHIGNFNSLAELRAEKLEIAKSQDPNTLFVCEKSVIDHVQGDVYSFGKTQDCDAHITFLKDQHMEISIFGEKFKANLPGGGEHRALTLSAVLLTQKLLDLDLSASLSLTSKSIPRGRGNRSSISGIDIIDDSYNANPQSMSAALEAFLHQRLLGRRIIVLGEMLELGDSTKEGHEKVAKYFSAFDKVFTVGDGFRLTPGSQWYPTVDKAVLKEIADFLRPGDSILIKGSNRIFWVKGFVEELIELLS